MTVAVTEVGTGTFTSSCSKAPMGKLRFVKLDVDELAPLASAFGVSSIPTVLLIEGDHVVGRSLGAKSASQLEVDLDLSSVVRGAA